MSIKGPPDEPGYRYQIGSHLSAATYADANSAWRDARRPQLLRADGRVEPVEPVMFVVAMEELGIHFCGRQPGLRLSTPVELARQALTASALVNWEK